MRVVPRLNEDVNEEWISDKTRFAYDGLKRQRIDTPMIRPAPDMALEPASWKEALELVAARLVGTDANRMAAFAGPLADAESMLALKDLCNAFGAEEVYCDVPAGMPADCRAAYTLGSTIAGVEEADAVLLISTNLRAEAPLLNARLRKRVYHNGVPVASIGPNVALTYEYAHLGETGKELSDLAAGKHAFSKVLASAKQPLVLVGAGAYQRADAAAVADAVRGLAVAIPNLLTDSWNGLGAVQPTAAAVGALDLGLRPVPFSAAALGSGTSSSEPLPYDLLYLLGYDDVDVERLPPDAFVVYQGHHGDLGAEIADVVLPGSAYTEKNATYANLEGRVQRTARAVSPPGEARDDWKILRALSEVSGKPLPYSDAEGMSERLAEVAPHLADTSEVVEPVSAHIAKAMLALPVAEKTSLDMKTPFKSCMPNFYLTNVVTRASTTMAACAAAFSK